MKKKVLLIGSLVIVAGVLYGLSEFFRTNEKAIDQKADVQISALSLGGAVGEGRIAVGDVVEVQGTIISAEERSAELMGGVLITKDETDMESWPNQGDHRFKALFNGVEVDDFFGDTLYRFSGGFLLEPLESEDLEQSNSEE